MSYTLDFSNQANEDIAFHKNGGQGNFEKTLGFIK
jgi:hypothetical protein